MLSIITTGFYKKRFVKTCTFVIYSTTRNNNVQLFTLNFVHVDSVFTATQIVPRTNAVFVTFSFVSSMFVIRNTTATKTTRAKNVKRQFIYER